MHIAIAMPYFLLDKAKPSTFNLEINNWDRDAGLGKLQHRKSKFTTGKIAKDIGLKNWPIY